MNLDLVVEVHVDNLNLEDEFTVHNLMIEHVVCKLWTR